MSEQSLNPSSDSISLTELLRALISLEREAKAAEEVAKELKSALQEMRVQVAERMALDGCDGMKIDGVSVFPRTDLYATFRPDGLDDEQVDELLARHGLEHLRKLTIHGGQFRSAMREIVNEAREAEVDLAVRDAVEALPEDLRPHVRIYEETRAMTRKA